MSRAANRPRAQKRKAAAPAPADAQANVAAIVGAARQANGHSLRADLAAYRRDLLRDGHADAARRMTRLIAEFDMISRGCLPRGEIRALTPREGGGPGPS